MKRALLATLLVVGCGSPIENGSVIIDELELGAVESDGPLSGGLELEIHLYEIGDLGERFISCAGAGTGLGDVDRGNSTFRDLSAHFEPSFGRAGTLLISDIDAELLRVRVTEDDEDPCPVEQNSGRGELNITNDDDLISVSDTFTKEQLSEGVELSFGSVPLLRLGTFPRFGRLE